MKDRGYNSDQQQCRVKLKELRQAYQKNREANSRSGSEPRHAAPMMSCMPFLGVQPPLPHPFDSINGLSHNRDVHFGDEEDEEEEVEDSAQQASGETIFPESQELFLTLDLEPVPPEPTQGRLPDPPGREETSAANVSILPLSSPSQRLVKIRRRKKCTCDEMFSELMLSSCPEKGQQNAWRQTMLESRKARYERVDRWQVEDNKWRVEDERWRQLADKRQESMLRLLEDQTDMLRHMVEVQERQHEHSPPLQPLCNQPPSSPSSIASSPRRPRTQWGGLRVVDLRVHPRGLPKQQKAGIQ
ncbi:uncharacterized protein LOC142069684 [Caretta caretta]|uniref:uncharacterized protein LOC142069684 n=1 Tax=Caretta caretta TaxID=8467 RepID=UPI003F4B2A0F